MYTTKKDSHTTESLQEECPTPFTCSIALLASLLSALQPEPTMLSQHIERRRSARKLPPLPTATKATLVDSNNMSMGEGRDG